MNFLKVIGQHFEASGLLELWIDSDLLGPKTAERVLAGKEYEKGMRAHKVTFQALWELLLPNLLRYLDQNRKELKQKVDDAELSDTSLVSIFVSSEFQEAIKGFVLGEGNNANCALWYEYLQMVSILLLFTRASRDGLWDLHLSSFKLMLPYFFQYSHTNYAKWGTVYLAEMHMLPEEIRNEFRDGKFVVKVGHGRFDQVDGDQGQEWLNGTGKKCGGIVGITKNVTALSRWALSFNLRSEISIATKEMFSIDLNHPTKHKETNLSRRKQDSESEDKVQQKLIAFGVFANRSDGLKTLVTKDQATVEITEFLLNAKENGEKQLQQFVQERLVAVEDGGDTTGRKKFHDRMKRNRSATFAKLYEVRKSDTQKVSLKADRSIFQRLIISYEAGRNVDLDEILKHELFPVPLALADTDSSLRTGQKSTLMNELCKKVKCMETCDVPEGATLLIDGQALVVSLGNPQSHLCHTFGDLSNIFLNAVYQYGYRFARIDVVFDRYDPLSMKEGTRIKRKKSRPVRNFEW